MAAHLTIFGGWSGWRKPFLQHCDGIAAGVGTNQVSGVLSMFRVRLVFAFFFLIQTSVLQAATLPYGQPISVAVHVNTTITDNFVGTVGAGLDVDIYGFSLFLNEGAGDRFYLRSKGYYCGWSCRGDDISIVVDGLEFGHAFRVEDVSSEFGTGMVTVLGPQSLSISWTNDGTDTQTYVGRHIFEGRFAAQAVPLPGSAIFLLTFLVAIGATRQTRRSPDK